MRLEVFLEARDTPSNYSFLSNKQAADVYFPIQHQFINKSERLIIVFINFRVEIDSHDVFAQHLAQLGFELSCDTNVQIPLFSI